MKYKSTLTKRIMKKLEKYGLNFLDGTYSLHRTNVNNYGHWNTLGCPTSFLVKEEEYFLDRFWFEYKGRKYLSSIVFYFPVSELVRKDVELDVGLGAFDVLEVYMKIKEKSDD